MTKVQKWLYGIGSAVIGGGSSAVVSSFTASVMAPEKFNLTDHVGNFFKMMGVTFAVNGAFSLFFYLKQSPLPPMNGDGTTEFLRKQALTPPPSGDTPKP